ncbi:MAG TPA: hypothetical protein VE573_19015, partial [Nitrososphaeraceae archaeon]|nr:hypothetical protein [Nitrososphaeraceae archaeon]
SFHNFANPQVINNLFTRLLNLYKNFSKLNVDFFQGVKKVDWHNQYKFLKKIVLCLLTGSVYIIEITDHYRISIFREIMQ